MLDDVSGKLKIINLENKNQISVQSGNGLMGEWARNSQSFLYGEMDFWGGIPGVSVYELEVNSGEKKSILFDRSQSLEFYQPRYTRDEGIFLASVRLRSSGAGRQLWLLSEGAEGIKQITTDPQFYYSFPSWSPDYSELVFQRFPINRSDGNPQVVIWNQDSDTLRVIAENASKPLWLP
jgi:Tol biopolymer transport system component